MATTIPQMVCRSNEGHHRVLRLLAQGRDPYLFQVTIGDRRGVRAVMRTLWKWGALDAADGLTETGRALLAAINARWPSRSFFGEVHAAAQ